MKIEKEKIVYRRASIDNVPVMVDYRVKFLNELCSHPENNKTAVIRKSLQDYFMKAIPSGDFIAWVAEYNGKVIATSGMVVWQRPAMYGVESGKLDYLLNFYTIPKARKKGIATRLLNELIKEARSIRLKYLHLRASKEGISIYKKAGFTEPKQTELQLKLE